MAVGNGELNAGLLNAAERSPALALCEQGDGQPTDTGGGDDGGEDGGEWGGAS